MVRDNLTSHFVTVMEPLPVVLAINLDVMFPGLEHQVIGYVFHVCGLWDFPSQTRLIDFEGIKTIEALANYQDSEIDAMADRNSKHTPAPTHVQMGLQRTKNLKAVAHLVVTKKRNEGIPCDLCELTPELLGDLIMEINAKLGKKDADAKLYYPDPFTSTDYKSWVKKVENYLDARTWMAGVPWSDVIRPVDADPFNPFFPDVTRSDAILLKWAQGCISKFT